MNRSSSDALPSGTSSIDVRGQSGPGGCGAANQQHWDDFAGAREAMGESAAEQTRWLSRTIETEIIPRLMLAHRSDGMPLLPEPGQYLPPSKEQVLEFARLALTSEAPATLGYVNRLLQDGVPLEAVYLDLLAPAARHLGALWEADLCDFADVTMGLWRLQQVMHELGPAFQASAVASAKRRRAILVPVPGSQHTMGLFMVAEFFRRAGWDVWGDAMASARDIVKAARTEWFDVIGFSVGTETHVTTLAQVIVQVRKASQNQALLVIIGGPVVNLTPGLVAQVGADASAEDAPQAVRQAEALLSSRSATP